MGRRRLRMTQRRREQQPAPSGFDELMPKTLAISAAGLLPITCTHASQRRIRAPVPATDRDLLTSHAVRRG